MELKNEEFYTWNIKHTQMEGETTLTSESQKCVSFSIIGKVDGISYRKCVLYFDFPWKFLFTSCIAEIDSSLEDCTKW